MSVDSLIAGALRRLLAARCCGCGRRVPASLRSDDRCAYCAPRYAPHVRIPISRIGDDDENRHRLPPGPPARRRVYPAGMSAECRALYDRAMDARDDPTARP